MGQHPVRFNPLHFPRLQVCDDNHFLAQNILRVHEWHQSRANRPRSLRFSQIDFLHVQLIRVRVHLALGHLANSQVDHISRRPLLLRRGGIDAMLMMMMMMIMIHSAMMRPSSTENTPAKRRRRFCRGPTQHHSSYSYVYICVYISRRTKLVALFLALFFYCAQCKSFFSFVLSKTFFVSSKP